MSLSRRELAVALCALFALSAPIIVPHVMHGGFYYDDWALSAANHELGLAGAVKQFFLSNNRRPLLALYLPALHAVFGLHMHAMVAWSAVLHVMTGWGLYAVFRVWGVGRRDAAVPAVLFVLFPYDDATWLWSTGSQASVAVLTYLLGTALALYGLDASPTRSKLLHCGAMGFYVTSVLTYELAVFAICFSLVLYVQRTGRPRAIKLWLCDLALIVPILVFVSAQIIPILPGGDVHPELSIGDQLTHAQMIAEQAVRLLARAAVPTGDPSGLVVAAAGLLGLIGATIVVHRRAGAQWRRDAVMSSLKMVALGALGSTLAYAVLIPADPYYSPLQAGIGNRINGFAAIGLVLIVWASARLTAVLLARSARAAIVIGLVLAVAVGVGYASRTRDDVLSWDYSVRLQLQVLAALRVTEPSLPHGSTVIAVGAPAYVTPGVPVFAAVWDLNGALRRTRDDPSLVAYPLAPGTVLTCSARLVVPSGNGFGARQASPYERTILLDSRRRIATSLLNRGTCISAARGLVLGPTTLRERTY